MSESTITGPNPSGLCMCGCGGKAPIAQGNDKRYGIVKGQPQRYIKGHRGLFKSKSDVPYIVDPDTGCWVWQRAVNSSGYGHLYVGGVHKYAHIHYYEMAHGVVDNSGRTMGSTQVHHLCGNRLCVNPEHLKAVDIYDHRVSHGIIKLTPSDAHAIKADTSKTTQEIADEYGIAVSHAASIRNGNSWTSA